ncbi:Crp/Fnr family transcriptional regulator [Mucilaginibacter flavus]|uniref:Crp/Fnr family transcriptional regulator n=1 Tax=Mucilaginibacter flavus TaxID=931504 RepID=UPI0025B5BEE8|nr:Crp/Fnr family transcriptional regulator [Mucilaginibacter flavus]MDN3583952.1 Crp/Fnr family transcriptional regulator [Mucilaginibacter flavus]
MINVFKEYLQTKGNYTAIQLETVVAAVVIKKLRKRQYLLQEGDVMKNHVFVSSGCLRSYTVDDKGMEHILNFAIENWWIGDRESLQTGQPSIYNIDAIEDSEVVLISRDKFDVLCQDVPPFNNMINAILQKSFNVAQNRIHTFISQSAEEKYLSFLEKFPHLATRVPQSMIASYLGITAETLSRVRKQIVKR